MDPNTEAPAWQVADADPSPQREIVVGRAPRSYKTIEPFDSALVGGDMLADLKLLEAGWGLTTSAPLRFNVDDLEPGKLLVDGGRTTTREAIYAESCRGPGD